MKPMITLEYIGDVTDNMRDARTTLTALKRLDPPAYEKLREEGVFSDIEELLDKVMKVRGFVHAKTYRPE